MWTVLIRVFVWKCVWVLTGTWMRILIDQKKKKKKQLIKFINSWKEECITYFEWVPALTVNDKSSIIETKSAENTCAIKKIEMFS